tara:strand:- start:221059 stop:222231 length:1173 start_codon:yes stop_codon:yes gene_type:complete
MKIGFVISILALLFTQKNYAQQFDYKLFVEEFTSETYLGRGYVNDGAIKAAKKVELEFTELGLVPIESEFLQKFHHTVNTFPKTPKYYCDSAWVAGRDFIVHPFSGSGKKSWEDILVIDSATYALHAIEKRDLLPYLNSFAFGEKAVVLPESKLTWSVAGQQLDIPVIQALKPNAKCKAKLKITAELKDITSYNVVGKIKGTGGSDSTFYITAHYDHLGAMGKVFIPGANDNAAGVAMLIDLAHKIKANPLKYDVVFIAFAGEEAGLLGSKYYSENPMTPLGEIKMLINLDLVGTGSDGATVVNATEFVDDFKKLTNINNSKKYLTKINARGSAANSDHYWFYKKDVPSFFIYTQGGPKAYHDINDIAKNLPYTSFDALQSLVLDFLNTY